MTIALVTKEDSPPCDWVKRSFYDLARITSGQVDPREQPYRSMVLVAPDHIRTGAGRIEERLTADQQGAISGKYLVKQGEIIYSKIRPNLQKLALATEDCLCSADMYPISARDGVSPQFLKYLLLSKPFTEFAISVSVRSGMPKINRQELAHFVIRAQVSLGADPQLRNTLSRRPEGTGSHRRGTFGCGCADRGAGAADRQEAAHQAGRDAGPPDRQATPSRVLGGVGASRYRCRRRDPR